MKKQVITLMLLSLLCGITACQEEISSSSIETSSFSSNPESSLLESSVVSGPSSSISYSYQPIGKSTNLDIFSNPIKFELTTTKIDKDAAENLINTDVNKLPEGRVLTKSTSLKSTRRESHVTVNRTTATYSVKDLIEEEYSTSQVDSNAKWHYTKNVQYQKTVYFVEDDLIRHIITENLYYAKDKTLFYVHSKQSYYEGMEDKGTFESYFYKIDNYSEDENGYLFAVHLESNMYFSNSSGLDKIDKTLYTNFTKSSSFYYSRNYKSMNREPTYEYHSSGKKGEFSCLAKDVYTYYSSDLDDSPSMEASEVSTINYSQDYMLKINDYLTYEEDFMTSSVSKNIKGETIRDETVQSRKTVTEDCDVFYPDLSKFEEREYTEPTTR